MRARIFEVGFMCCPLLEGSSFVILRITVSDLCKLLPVAAYYFSKAQSLLYFCAEHGSVVLRILERTQNKCMNYLKFMESVCVPHRIGLCSATALPLPWEQSLQLCGKLQRIPDNN